MTEARSSNKKTLTGSVVKSGKTEKTVVVAIERLTKHPFYGKYVKRRVRYAVHDEKAECKTGDRVRIIETSPVSRTKRWRVVEVVERAQQ